MFSTLATDLRDAVRPLRRTPTSSLLVVAVMALTMAANMTVLNAINTTMLRRLNVAQPERLMAISLVDIKTGARGLIYEETFDALRARQRSFSALSMHSIRSFRIQARNAPVDVIGEGVMPSYFDMLGVRPVSGRVFGDADVSDAGGVPTAVVISERLWRRVFNGDPVVGEALEIEGRAATILGVAHSGFHGLDVDSGSDLFLPLPFARQISGDPPGALRATSVLAQLAPHATFTTGTSEIGAVWPLVQTQEPSSLPARIREAVQSQRPSVESLSTGMSGLRRQYGNSLVIVLGLAAVFFAVSCMNLLGVLLARTAARFHEMRTRVALGAGRLQLVRTFAVEGALLVVSALVIAWPIAVWAGDVLTAAVSVARPVPLQSALTPSWQIVALVASTSVLLGVGVSMVPAWNAAAASLLDTMRAGRAVTATIRRTGRSLIVVQVTLAIVLAVTAGLLVRTLATLNNNHASLAQKPVLWTVLIRNPLDRGTTVDYDYWRAMVQELSDIPHAESAALSSSFPAYFGFAGPLRLDTFATPSDAATGAPGLTELVTPNFFRTFDIPLLSGRDFTWDDREGAPPVVIVNQALARKLFGDGAMGARLRVTSGQTTTDLEVIGVVGDTPIGSLREPNAPVAFRPLMQDLARAQSPNAHVSVAGDIGTARAAYVRTVEARRRHVVRGLFTFDEWTGNALLQERLLTGAGTAAGSIATLLAGLGVFGLLSFSVSQRVREIGIRMSLGATRRSVLSVLMSDVARPVFYGIALGLPIAVVATWWIQSKISGLAQWDLAGALIPIALFAVVGAVACLGPGLRAMRIDPARALKEE